MPYYGVCPKCGELLHPPPKHVERRIRRDEGKKWVAAILRKFGNGKLIGDILDIRKSLGGFGDTERGEDA